MMKTIRYNYVPVTLCIALSTPLLGSTANASQKAVEHIHTPASETNEERRAADGHEDQAAHPQQDHQGQYEAIIINPGLAQEAGLKTRIAGPGSIERHINVYGRLVTPPDQIVQNRARFPGIIREVRVNVGDEVSGEQVLAVIESNESLRDYELLSPIAGVVQERRANVGEVTGEAALFTVVNSDTLWAQLKIFPSLRFEVQAGQDVHVNHNGHLHDGQIENVTPGIQGQPYVLARVTLENTRGDMAPGDMVSAQIDAEKVEVALTVENSALHTLDEQTVVFVQDGKHYTARAVSVGRTDGRFTEVHSGLKAGEQYVADNSYLLKAELLKSGASHDH